MPESHDESSSPVQWTRKKKTKKALSLSLSKATGKEHRRRPRPNCTTPVKHAPRLKRPKRESPPPLPFKPSPSSGSTTTNLPVQPQGSALATRRAIPKNRHLKNGKPVVLDQENDEDDFNLLTSVISAPIAIPSLLPQATLRSAGPADAPSSSASRPRCKASSGTGRSVQHLFQDNGDVALAIALSLSLANDDDTHADAVAEVSKASSKLRRAMGPAMGADGMTPAAVLARRSETVRSMRPWEWREACEAWRQRMVQGAMACLYPEDSSPEECGGSSSVQRERVDVWCQRIDYSDGKGWIVATEKASNGFSLWRASRCMDSVPCPASINTNESI